mgnify:CR=1 FL=1
MPIKVHSLVQYPHYIDSFIYDPEEDHMRACSHFSISPSDVANIYGFSRISGCLFYTGPEIAHIFFGLFNTPLRKGVIPDCAQIDFGPWR